MHANEPVNKNGAHIFIDLGLSLHVEAVGFCAGFLALHVSLDVGAVLGDMVDVGKRSFVELAHIGDDVALNSLVVHRKLRLQSDFGELVARSEA